MDTKKRKISIIKNTGRYSLVQYFSQGIGFVIAIALRKFLGPYYMGIWSLLKVIHGYLSYGDMGVSAAAAYKIPFFRGKKDRKSEILTRDTAFSFLFVMSVISSLLLIIAAFVLRNKYSPVVIYGLIALSVYIILERLYSAYIVMLRANKDFKILTQSMLFDSIVNLILVFLLVKQFKIYGLYCLVSVLAVLNTIYVHKKARYEINFRLDFSRLKGLITYGFPLLISGVLGEILRTIDSIMIAKMLGIVFLGYYSIAMIAKNYMYGLSNNLGIITIPHIQEMYGKNEDMQEIKKFVTIPAETIAYLLAPVIGAMFIVMPVIIEGILPKYVPGIIALQILFLDSYFRSCCTQAEQFIIALEKQTRLIPISIAAIVMNIILNMFFIKIGWGIGGVALGTSITSFFVFVTIIAYSMNHFSSLKEICLFLIRIVFPIFYIGVVLAISQMLINVDNIYLRAVLHLVILGICSIPLIFHINKRTEVIKIIINLIFRRGKNES